MKQIFLIIVASCMTLFGQAATTDVESLDNTLYISSMTVTQSEQVNISVKMKNTVTISGFTFEVYLPEGMSFVLKQDGTPEGSFNEERVPAGMFDLTSETQTGNGAKFQTSVPQSHIDDNPYFLGSNGEIMTFTVSVDDNMSAGDYTIVLRNMELTNHANGQRASDLRKVELETTITVAPAYFILDENATETPIDATDVNLLVRRTITANNWSSICLPFTMTEAQCKEAFGEDVQIADFTGAEVNGDGSISVNFSYVTAMEANHPYIIKVSNNVTEFSVDGVDIAPSNSPRVDKDKQRTNYNSFIGTYVAETVVPDYCLFLSGNQFWFSTGNTKMKAFRAYFDLETAGADYTTLSSANIHLNVMDDETTNVDRIVNGELRVTGATYDLQGRRIRSASPLDSSKNGQWKKGVYVRDGKKVVIK